MKTYTRRTFSIITTIAVLTIMPSCAFFQPGSTPEEKQQAVRALCYSASSIGTFAAIQSKPEWRPAFDLAYTNLNALVESKQITGQTLRNIVASLPINELTSPLAKIVIDNATMLFDMATGKPINLEDAPMVLAAATGIRDGMAVGLGKKLSGNTSNFYDLALQDLNNRKQIAWR